MQFTDSHIHLQDYKEKNKQKIISDMKNLGFSKIICASSHPSDWSKIAQIALTNPDFVIPAFGVPVGDQDGQGRAGGFPFKAAADDLKGIGLLTGCGNLSKGPPQIQLSSDKALIHRQTGRQSVQHRTDGGTVAFTKESSQWCFQRSMESEHFVCFWEEGLTLKNNTITYGGYSVNVKTLLNNGEKIWKKYGNF